MGPQDANVALVMDRAYQGDETHQLALDLGFTPVVPPLKTRTDPWEYDREMYKRRNEVERLFRRLKGYRRIFSRLGIPVKWNSVSGDLEHGFRRSGTLVGA